MWIVDRREQALEDTTGFASGDPERAQDYYLGFRYRRVLGEDAKFVADWGLRRQLGDLRRMIRLARAGGRRVILGGHSAGASTAVAYAAWDFGGRPGYRDLHGLVLIDGGLLGSFRSAGLRRARRELADIRRGDVFNDILGLGIPDINGIFAQLGALWAYKRPDEPSVLQQYPALPDAVKPEVRATNEALLGFAFDVTTSPEFLSILHVRAGHLAASGNPRGWVDGELTPLRSLAREGVGGALAQRDRVVLPAAARARHRRRELTPGRRPRRATSACGCGTAAGSTCRRTRSAPRSPTAASRAEGGGSCGGRGSRRPPSSTIGAPGTSTRSRRHRRGTTS